MSSVVLLSFNVSDFRMQPSSTRDTDHEEIAALLTVGCSDSSTSRAVDVVMRRGHPP
jgi:hypothetical protein